MQIANTKIVIYSTKIAQSGDFMYGDFMYKVLIFRYFLVVSHQGSAVN